MIIHELRFPVYHAGPIVIHGPVHKLLVAVGIATTPFSWRFARCWMTGMTHDITHRLPETGQH